MESKYYTPEISEFYVGFEYEIKTPILLGFVDSVYNEDDFNEGAFKKGTEFRVKYLDKEDIESLGWKMTDLNRPFEYSFNKYYLQIPNSHPYGSIRIYERGGNGTWATSSINLIIKNKSELQKIMQQLNIQ